MTQNRKQSSTESDAKNPAFEQQRLHPALRLNQEYPEIKPQRYWAGPKDDATAPARPQETMTDLDPELRTGRNTDPQAALRRNLMLLMGFIIIFGFVVLFLLVTRSIGG